MSFPIFLAILVSVSLNASAHILLRKAMLVVNANGGLEQQWLSLAAQVALNPFLVAGMTLYAASIVIWLYVLSKIEVSMAYPYQSIGYVIAGAVGFFYLGENITPFRVAGIALICAGLFFIARDV
jgi:drug/metabolite transporter (DMT)-like permease